MSSNDLPDINNNLKGCLLTDTTNENNKALKTVIVAPTKTHTMQCLTVNATAGTLFINKGNSVNSFNGLDNPSSSYYGYFYVWSNTASSGVTSVTIYGLDNNYNESSETITLASPDNTVSVQSVNQYRWINKMVGFNRGSSTSVEVYCAYTSANLQYLVCSQTYYVDYNAFFMVPRGYIARLTSIDNYGGTTTNTFSLCKWVKNNTSYRNPQAIIYLSSFPVGGSRIYANGGGIGEFTEGEILLWAQVATSSTTSNITATFTLYPLANYV